MKNIIIVLLLLAEASLDAVRKKGLNNNTTIIPRALPSNFSLEQLDLSPKVDKSTNEKQKMSLGERLRINSINDVAQQFIQENRSRKPERKNQEITLVPSIAKILGDDALVLKKRHICNTCEKQYVYYVDFMCHISACLKK